MGNCCSTDEDKKLEILVKDKNKKKLISEVNKNWGNQAKPQKKVSKSELINKAINDKYFSDDSSNASNCKVDKEVKESEELVSGSSTAPYSAPGEQNNLEEASLPRILVFAYSSDEMDSLKTLSSSGKIIACHDDLNRYSHPNFVKP